MTLKLALRGLWRHKLRTIFTLIAVACGHLLLLVYMSLHTGGHGKMIELGIRQGNAGHVVIQATGYQQSRAVELLVPDSKAIKEAIARLVPRALVLRRAFGAGLARSSSDAVGVMFAGVEPTSERSISGVASHMRQGVYLDKDTNELWCARKSHANRPQVQRVVIGEQLAKTLRIQLCDKLILDTQGLGDQEAAQFRVVGIFKTGNADLDGFFVQMPLADAQQILHLDGGVHQLALFVESAKQSAALAQTIRHARDDQGRLLLAAHGDMEALTWDEALPEVAEFVWLDASSGWIFMIIIFVIIAIGVLNTMLMSVMERTREFGVMRALGMHPFSVLRLVLAEGFVIGILGITVGMVLATPILYYVQTTGIDLTAFAEGAADTIEMGGMTMSVMYGKTSSGQILFAAIAVFGMAVTSATYPAIRAARLPILRAIHNV